MNRQIEFRGKRVDNGEWVYGWLIRGQKKDRIWYIVADILTSQLVPVDPATIGQFTGLLDKNGKKIFEGDIVVKDGYIWFDDDKPNYRGTVEWVFSQWQVIAHCVNPNKRGISNGANFPINDDGIDDGQKTDWQVIGSIHNNPELIP